MNKWYSAGFCKETFRRLLVPGVIFSALVMLVAVFQPILMYYNEYQAEAMTIDGSTFNSSYKLIYYVMAPVLMLLTFHFLNARNKSDFYHALPKTRQAIYISGTLAVLYWVSIALVSSAVVESILCLFLQGVYINWYGILILVLNTFAGSVVTMGMMGFAMSLTGTGLTNVVLYGMILIIPKLLIQIFILEVTSVAPVLTSDFFGIFGSMQYNIASDQIVSLNGLLSGDLGWWYTSVGAGIYSVVAGLIYLVLGGLLFVKRKSEMAATSAPNKVMQHVFRTAFGLAFCILPLVALIEDEYLTAFFLYCIAVIACFAYEMITTKRFRNAGRAWVSLVALLVINALFIGGVFGVGNYTLNRDLQVDGFIWNYQSTGIFYDNQVGYQDLMAKDIVIRDPNLCKLVEETYKENCAGYKNTGGAFMGIILDDNSGNGNSYPYTVRVYHGFGPKTYKLNFTEEVYQKIADALSANQEYMEANRKLPEKNYTVNTDADITTEEAEKIFAIFKTEVKALTYDQWETVLGSSMNYASYSKDYLSLYVTGNVGTTSYYNAYGVYSSLTPKTFEALTAAINKKGIPNVLETLSETRESTYYNIDMWVYSSNGADPVEYSFAGDSTSTAIPQNAYNQMVSAIQAQEGKNLDTTKLFCYVSVYVESNTNGKNTDSQYEQFPVCYFNVDESFFEGITSQNIPGKA